MEKSNSVPMFKLIKESIVEDILSSVYLPGDMIPTQEEYARKFNVSRLTVRKAMDDLILKGILRSEKGRGTFVQEIVNNTYSYKRLAGFYANVASNNVKVVSRVLSIGDIEADQRVSAMLKIPLGDSVVHIKRLRYANKICIAFQSSFIPRELVREIDFTKEDLEHGSLYQILQDKAGIIMGFAEEHFRAIRASAEIAAYFEVEEGDPILYIGGVTYDKRPDYANRPVEYCENFNSSDANGIWVKSLTL